MALCKLQVCDYFRRLGKADAPGERSAGRVPTLHLCICLKTEENHGKPVMVAERRSADPNSIRLVDLAIAGDCLDWRAGPCRP